MRFYNQQHRFYCGVDLHARTLSLHVLDAAGESCLAKTHPANSDAFLKAVAPFRVCDCTAPPIQCSAASTRSLALSTVTITRSSNSRATRRRSAGVVVAADQTAGRSAASARIAAASAADSLAGAACRQRSYSSSSRRCRPSASSPRRYSSRATSRFSGSHAWYCRAARSAP
jgi:hypothetical protein